MSQSSLAEKQESVEVVFVGVVEDVSSEEPSMGEWSSLILDMSKLHEGSSGKLTKTESGEICTKLIGMSDSAIFRHPYFKYPVVTDPGIKEALLFPEDKIEYPDDGQLLYLDICKEMNICPIRGFHRGLLEDCIDLKYYGVNPVGVRAMSMALRLNKIVQVIDLTDNFLTEDSCYHLGQALKDNNMLKELILSGCKLGPEGSKQLCANLQLNRTLRTLNLARNHLEDNGVQHLATSIFKGFAIKQINLSYNKIGLKGAQAFASALETNNKITHLNISWNNLYPVPAVCSILRQLSQSTVLQELNLSWNSLAGEKTGSGLKALLLVPSLQCLDLSNNKIDDSALKEFTPNIIKANKLCTLNLSFNPLTPVDAYKLLERFKKPKVKVKELLLDNIYVTTNFLKLLDEVLNMKSRKNNTVITFGGVLGKTAPSKFDVRDVVLNRCEYLGKMQKKQPVDVCLLGQKLLKEYKNGLIPTKNFMDAAVEEGARFDDDLVNELGNVFKGPPSKIPSINLLSMVEFMKRKWPDRRLPPTPPPELEPEPVVKEPKAKGKKGKR